MPDDASPLLIELVRRYSPSEREAAAVRYLVDWLGAHGVDAREDEVGNAVGARGPEDAPHTLLLLGHIDTVPGEIPVRVENGALYGRGTVDAKGSLCAFAEAAAQATLPEGWRVIIIGAVCEETDSRGAYAARDRYQPDACIIGEPSGADRITLGYKGHVWFRYTLRRPIVHTSRPEPSVGALGAAFWQAITRWAETANEGRARVFDQVMPHLGSINTESDGFEDTLRMTISVRLPPHLSPDDAHAAIAPLTEPDGLLEVDRGVAAYRAEKNNMLVRGMVTAIRAQGSMPGFVLKAGTSDMNVVGARWACPIIAYGPGDSHLDHTPGEHLLLSEYVAAVATLRHFIEQLEPAPRAFVRTSAESQKPA